jgi:hypothetical protein
MRQTSPTFTGSESIISLVLRYLAVPRLGLALEVPTQWTCGLRSVLQQARAPLATAHLLPRARDLLQSRRHVSQKRCYAAIVPGAACMHTHHGPTAHFIFSMVVEHVLPGRADEPRISRSHVSPVRIRSRDAPMSPAFPDPTFHPLKFESYSVGPQQKALTLPPRFHPPASLTPSSFTPVCPSPLTTPPSRTHDHACMRPRTRAHTHTQSLSRSLSLSLARAQLLALSCSSLSLSLSLFFRVCVSLSRAH